MSQSTDPIPMIITCPSCSKRHVDAGEYATKPHHTHSCQFCGLTWRPAIVPTVGVQFLPGFKDDPHVDPPDEIKRWATVEIFGNEKHRGTIFNRADEKVVDELQRDGSFRRFIYNRAAVFCERPSTERDVRMAVVPVSRASCYNFLAPSARAGACRSCGHDEPDHAEAVRRREVRRLIIKTLGPDADSGYGMSVAWQSSEPGAFISNIHPGNAHITLEEWRRLDAAGVPVVPFSDRGKSDPDADDDIPF